MTGSTDRSLKLWDLAGGACRAAKALGSGGTLRAPSACNALDVSDDGATIVSGHQVTRLAAGNARARSPSLSRPSLSTF